MRKALLLFGFVCSTLPVAAEPPSENVLRPDPGATASIYVEPHLGINYSFLQGNPRMREQIPGEGDTEMYNSASGIAPLVGVTLGLQLSPTGGLELDFAYDGHSASNSGVTDDGCEIFVDGQSTGEIILEPTNKEYTVAVDYFSIGLTGTLRFDQVFVFAGPQVALPVSSSVEETMRWSDATTECRYFFGTPEETIEVAGSPEGHDAATRFSIRLGVGAAIAVAKRIEIVPRLAYDIGLTDLFEGDGDYLLRQPGGAGEEFLLSELNNAMRVSALQASVGVRILL